MARSFPPVPKSKLCQRAALKGGYPLVSWGDLQIYSGELEILKARMKSHDVGKYDLSTGALTGLRVLDLTGRMGGYCGLLLANLGADVILIEPPGGDPMRHEGPFKNDTSHPEQSLSFAAYHTNKRGIVLNLEDLGDQQKFRELVRNADVLIEDKPIGYLVRHDLGYDQLKAINPTLVMTSISGFGLSGRTAISRRRASSLSPWAG